MKFLDTAKVYVRSGNGGAGCVSFRREAHVEFGGPDGGTVGGDVIVEAVDGLNTLIDFRYQQHLRPKLAATEWKPFWCGGRRHHPPGPNRHANL